MEYKNFLEVFQSVGDFIHTLKKREVNKSFQKREMLGLLASHDVSADRTKWTSTESFDVATELMIKGDLDSARKIQACKIDNQDKESIAVIQSKKSVCGSFPLVPIAISGVPKSMLNFSRIAVCKNKVLNLYLNTGAFYNVTTSELSEVGAKVLGIVRALELADIRCNVYVGSISLDNLYPDYQTLGMFVNVKKAEAPLNVLRMSYFLVNPSFLRRHVFSWREKAPLSITRGWKDNYGRTATREEMVDFLKNQMITGTNNQLLLYTELLQYRSINKIVSDILQGKFSF